MRYLVKNAPKGVLDRAIDINVGSADFAVVDYVEEPYLKLLPSEDVKKSLIAGITKQYGSVAPEFIRALLHEMDEAAWETELDEITQKLVNEIPHYVSSGGARRVLQRFALGGLAGRVALRNGIFDNTIVDEEMLFNSVLVNTYLWVITRWDHMYRLANFLVKQGRIPISTPRSGLLIYRHNTNLNDMPTIMVSKECLERVYSGARQVEVMSKSLKEDEILVRADAGRNTIGKPAYYHLKSDWMLEHGFQWSSELEMFEVAEI